MHLVYVNRVINSKLQCASDLFAEWKLCHLQNMMSQVALEKHRSFKSSARLRLNITWSRVVFAVPIEWIIHHDRRWQAEDLPTHKSYSLCGCKVLGKSWYLSEIHFFSGSRSYASEIICLEYDYRSALAFFPCSLPLLSSLAFFTLSFRSTSVHLCR